MLVVCIFLEDATGLVPHYVLDIFATCQMCYILYTCLSFCIGVIHIPPILSPSLPTLIVMLKNSCHSIYVSTYDCSDSRKKKREAQCNQKSSTPRRKRPLGEENAVDDDRSSKTTSTLLSFRYVYIL